MGRVKISTLTGVCKKFVPTLEGVQDFSGGRKDRRGRNSKRTRIRSGA